MANDDLGANETADFEKAGAMTSAMATRSRDEMGIRMISTAESLIFVRDCEIGLRFKDGGLFVEEQKPIFHGQQK